MERARLDEAMDEVTKRRDEGENIALALDDIADAYEVKAEHLIARAEEKWGAPIADDIDRNRSHFAEVARRKKEAALRSAEREFLLREAGKSAASTWLGCFPDGRPDWSFVAKRFLETNGVSDPKDVRQINNLFSSAGADFAKAQSAYIKLRGPEFD